MRLALAACFAAVVPAFAADPPGPTMPPVNTQPSLTKALGLDVSNAEWEYPKGVAPASFAGLTRVSGPDDAGLAPKAAWRKPLLFRDDTTGAEVAVNVFRARMPQPEPPAKPGTPAAPLTEPDYRYEAADFHDGKAAVASVKGRAVFAFVDGGCLIKVEAFGGKKPDALPALAKSTAETIWAFRQKK